MTNEEINYVLGFLFDEKRERVVLIRKNRPKKLAGFLNGIGGKINYSEEEGWEFEGDAMSREFREETGVEDDIDWLDFGIISGRNYVCQLYKAFNTKALEKTKTVTDEEVIIKRIEEIDNLDPCLSNVKYLIGAALDDSCLNIEVEYKK